MADKLNAVIENQDFFNHIEILIDIRNRVDLAVDRLKRGQVGVDEAAMAIDKVMRELTEQRHYLVRYAEFQQAE